MVNEKIKILLSTSSFGEEDRSPINRLESEGFEPLLNPYKRKLTKNELISLLPGIKGIIAGLETLDREVLLKSELRVISRCGAGLSNVDLKAAKEMEIVVMNTPFGPTNAVAELTLAALLSMVRRIPKMNEDLHINKWSKMIGREISGMYAVVVGFGNIGKRVAKLLMAFGTKVCAVDPFYSGEIDGIQIVDLDQALKTADIISVHCSGEECLIGEKEFGLIKPGAYLLNAARGGVVDEPALIAALKDGRIAGAWIDTFKQEPYSGVLTRYPQVLLTPHVGSYTLECRRSMEMESVENLVQAFKGLMSNG